MIYFYQGEKTGLIKIGYSSKENLDSRLSDIQSYSPDKLILLKVVEGDYSVETMIHRKFRDARSHGEWFKPVDSLLDFINPPSEAQKYTPEICRLYTEESKSIDYISQKLTVSKFVIESILTKNSIGRRDDTEAWKYVDAVCFYYVKKRKSLVWIANTFNATEHTIKKILNSEGITLEHKGRYKRSNIWQYTTEICRLYTEKHLSFSKIADIFRTNPTQIRRILISQRIEIRKYSPRT